MILGGMRVLGAEMIAALLFMAFVLVLGIIASGARWRAVREAMDENKEGERLEAYIDRRLLDETKENMTTKRE
jgi:hypothetical protein